MKKTLKKTISIVLALLVILSLSVTAFAAGISADNAKEIALNDAGYSSADVVYITAEYDFDDGRQKWNVDFLVEEDGRYKDYDYEISASDGRIFEREWDYEDDYFPVSSNGNVFERIINAIIAWILSIFS